MKGQEKRYKSQEKGAKPKKTKNQEKRYKAPGSGGKGAVAPLVAAPVKCTSYAYSFISSIASMSSMMIILVGSPKHDKMWSELGNLTCLMH